MISTPAYSGKVDIPYAISLADTKLLLAANNIELCTYITASGSLLVAERNRIIENFWASDCTHLLCIDGDIGWPADAVLSMLKSGKDFIAACYPARGAEKLFLFRPSLLPNGAIAAQDRWLKMEYVPAGFMMITKHVIKAMRQKHPDLYFEPKHKNDTNPASGYCFFNTEVWQGEFWGEDYVFCRKAREAGIDLWVDPTIPLNHAGQTGALIQVLTTDPARANNTISEAA